ncbi:MAG: ATP-binding protein [Halioglobus sp.]
MKHKARSVNNIASLTNVTLTAAAMEASIGREASVPGITCLYGPSGWGKSQAAAYVRREYEAYYIEAKSVWSRKTYLLSILKDMGIPVLRQETLPELMEKVAEELSLSGRPLIIDEVDYLVDKGFAPLIMDIYQSSHASIMIVGEERLPTKLLEKHEKIHNRVMHWIAAQPASLDDCRKLADLLAGSIDLSDDLLEHISEAVHGCTRRIAVNINKVREAAEKEGISKLDRDWWGKRELYTGSTPSRRV